MRLSVALGLAASLVVGCSARSDDRLVGVWMGVPEESVIPALPMQMTGVPNDLMGGQFIKMAMLKLRTDHTYVLSLPSIATGKWSLTGKTLRLVPDKKPPGGSSGPMDLMPEVREATLNADGTRILLKQPSPIGEIELALKKTA